MRTGLGRYVPHLATTFTPSDIAGLVAWYDASDAGSITASGSPAKVSQWNDLSGNGRHVSQGTGSRQPTTGSRTINSLNALSFFDDGANSSALDSASLTINQPNTVFFVCKSDTGTGNQVLGDGLVGREMPAIISSTWHMYAGAGWSSSGVGGDTAAHVITSTFNGASSTMWIDGASHATSPGTDNLTGGIRIGAGADFGAPWDGLIGEHIRYTGSLSSTDRQAVEDYLQVKWGTP